jgi:membrane dipeptidase
MRAGNDTARQYNMAVALPPGTFIVDAHQDLAYHCQEHSRDLVDPGGVECMITLPLLIASGVRLVCATFFTPHTGTIEERRLRLEKQWEMYQQWFTLYPEVLWPIRAKADLARLANSPGIEFFGVRGHPVGVILLMEGCDLLESPGDLQTWHGRGLRMASLTWNGVNKYAGGTFALDSGLTPLGLELLTEFRRLGVVLDLSHLGDNSAQTIFEEYDGPLCATHSNSRTVAESPRNLLDSQALSIAARGGVVGLNLLASFVRGGWKSGDELPPVSEATEHVEYLCGLIGPEHVGLGSDLDGGLTPSNTPQGIDRIDHLAMLFDDLRTRSWDDQKVSGFAGGNWWRFFERNLPD